MNYELFEIPSSRIRQDDSDPELVEALEIYDRGEWLTVLPKLQKLAAEGNLLAIFKLANTFDYLESFEAAEHFWRIAIAAGHTGSANNLANLLKDQGRHDEVLDLYKASAEDGSADALFNIGLLLDDSDPEIATGWFHRAYEAGHPKVCALLALQQLEQKNTEEALVFAREGIRRKSIYAAVVVAMCCKGINDWQAAYDACVEGLEFATPHNVPDQIHAYRMAVLSLVMLGRFDEAASRMEEMREKSMDVMPEFESLLAVAQDLLNSNPSLELVMCPECNATTVSSDIFCEDCGANIPRPNGA